jgi:Bor protein
MKKLWFSAASTALIIVASTGCYHATIETGATPSTETISKQWAAGWILGLVPPSTVETAAKCPHGVAKVETQLSFLNQLVSWLTIYIYTPMTIEVTCAAPKTADASTSPADLTVSRADGPAAVTSTFATAATRSAELHRAVTVEVQ